MNTTLKRSSLAINSARMRTKHLKCFAGIPQDSADEGHDLTSDGKTKSGKLATAVKRKMKAASKKVLTSIHKTAASPPHPETAIAKGTGLDFHSVPVHGCDCLPPLSPFLAYSDPLVVIVTANLLLSRVLSKRYLGAFVLEIILSCIHWVMLNFLTVGTNVPTSIPACVVCLSMHCTFRNVW